MVFDTFPDNPDLYNSDLRPIVSETIERFGKNEWRAAILTTEMHGHLGIYAILGVKMGIRALEYLGAEAGQVRILSSAGIAPPVSCLNDGLQVSTEATLGHGLISSPSTDVPEVNAVFSTESKSIRIRLKKEVAAIVTGEIDSAVARYGHSPAYWSYVRKLAVEYWHALDRNEIFDITEQ